MPELVADQGAGQPDAGEFLDLSSTDGTLTVHVRGSWVFENVPALEAASAVVIGRPEGQVIFQCAGLEEMDLAGAWVLHDRSQQLRENGVESSFQDFQAQHFKFLQHIIDMAAVRDYRPEGYGPEPPHRLRAGLEAVGAMALQRVEDTGQFTRWIFDGVRRPSRLIIGETIRQVHQTGVSAIPVVMMITFLIGIVLAYQGASQLEKFGAMIFVVDMVSIGINREMGALLAAVMVAGRSGSAFAAALGTMKLNEEVDAMRVLGLNPNQLLVLPRVLGLLIALPALTMFANLAGLAGGALITIGALDISTTQFIDRVSSSTDMNDFLAGVMKAPVFAFLIAAVGTLRGLQVRRSAEELGFKTTEAVVQSIFLIIVADACFTTIFTRIGF